MKELSIFIDESGDFGETSDFYLIALVFHDQSNSIERRISRYEFALHQKGLQRVPFHAGPLINGKDEYANMPKEDRRHMLSAFNMFARHLPFSYLCLSYRKSKFNNQTNKLITRMKRDLIVVLFDQLDSLQKFDKVKIYYDNGQAEVREIIHNAVEYVLANETVMYRDATPRTHYLFQVADYICTIELTAIKFSEHKQTATDLLFFGNKRMLSKNFLRYLRNKRIE